MAKGLKKMVEEATALPPVKMSDDAKRGLANQFRLWSGWRDAVLTVGKTPTGSPAMVIPAEARVILDADRLVLNPNRVVNSVTPFRLRQEGVMTGALLHEAAHARFSKWRPMSEAEAKADPQRWLHDDGASPSPQTVALARVLEEARIEGLVFKHAGRMHATGLEWTLRATAAHIMTPSTLNADPNQQVLDVLCSWIKRAGRVHAITNRGGDGGWKTWVTQFDRLVVTIIDNHVEDFSFGGVGVDVLALCKEAFASDDHTGSTMIDTARAILDILFPNLEEEERPEPKGGCASEDSDDSDESDESDEADDVSGNPEDGDSEDGDSEDGDSEDGDEGDGDEGDGDEGDGDEGDGDSGSGSDSNSEGGAGAGGNSEPYGVDTDSDIAKALAAMENIADTATEKKVEEDQQAEPTAQAIEDPFADEPKVTDGWGAFIERGDWRHPTKAEREYQRKAEVFLRDLVAPTEVSKTTVTDSPSALVDGAAYLQWREAGGTRAPRFFKQTRREVADAPPVKIAILVDISGSMDPLMEPSALLSWAMASAALDLQNFAGRGTQVESTLIHWGTNVRVIQPNGGNLPGLYVAPCNEGTTAMHEALTEVERQIPGFFDTPEKQEHRLLVQFTDWELMGRCSGMTQPIIEKALASGVNMLTVTPSTYSDRYSDYQSILGRARIKRGKTALVKFSPLSPHRVWDEAAALLR